MKFRKIKHPHKFKFYSKTSMFRYRVHVGVVNGSYLQFAQLSPREIEVFYSSL